MIDYICSIIAPSLSTLWQQATIVITCYDHSIITCSRHIFMGDALPFVVNQTFNATPMETLQQHLRLLHTYANVMQLRHFCAFGTSFMWRSVHTPAIVGLCKVTSEFSWFCDAWNRVGLNSTLSRHCSVQVVMDSRPGTEFSVGVV